MKTVSETNLETNLPIETTPPEIDLREIAAQIAGSAKGLQKIAKDTKKPVLVQVKSILKKVPQLEVLPHDLTIFRLKAKGDIYNVTTLSVYNLDGTVVLATPSLEILEDGFEFISYKYGIGGYCDISYNGLCLRIAISLSDEHLEYLVRRGLKGLEGSGIPNHEYLRNLPQPELPLHSDELPYGKVMTIIGSGKFTKEYKTPLIDIECETGEIFKNVICNQAVKSILTKYKVGAKFGIVGKEKKTDKTGKSTYIVQITDLQGLDFVDL